MLALLAVVAMLSAGALHDALFATQLAGSRALHQQASVVAELGMQSAMSRLSSATPPRDVLFTVHPLDDARDTATVHILAIGAAAPVPGFSVGRFESQHYRIESTAYTERNVTATHMQGAVRLIAAAPDAVEEP